MARLPDDWRSTRFDTGYGGGNPDVPAVAQTAGIQRNPFMPPPPIFRSVDDGDETGDTDPGIVNEITFNLETQELEFNIVNTDGTITRFTLSLPDWFRVVPGAAPHTWQVDDLPTSDPGSNGIWLSPT